MNFTTRTDKGSTSTRNDTKSKLVTELLSLFIKTEREIQKLEARQQRVLETMRGVTADTFCPVCGRPSLDDTGYCSTCKELVI